MRSSRGQDAAAGLGRGTRANSTLCRGTSHARQRTALGPYSRTMPRALWGSSGGGLFLMSEVPLYGIHCVGDEHARWHPHKPDAKGLLVGIGRSLLRAVHLSRHK